MGTDDAYMSLVNELIVLVVKNLNAASRGVQGAIDEVRSILGEKGGPISGDDIWKVMHIFEMHGRGDAFNEVAEVILRHCEAVPELKEALDGSEDDA